MSVVSAKKTFLIAVSEESVPERVTACIVPKACRRNDDTSYLVELALVAEIEYCAKSAEGKVWHPFLRGAAGDL
jgi:hypothetical protein